MGKDTGKKRIFSGIQPTGEVHLGNYLGAIKQWKKYLDEYDCIFCIVDYHAITVEREPGSLREAIMQVAAVYMACGLTPDRCTLFVQSHVPLHTELCWIFNTLTPLGLLYRMTQFKEKTEGRKKADVNAGLLDYPVLQAADILLYKAERVPVGEDQLQHIELTREIARKFNNRYGEYFPEPQALLSPSPRILGLDGRRKMSKSLGNHVGLVEDPDSIRKKIMRAVTDTARVRKSDPGEPERCNLYSWHKAFTPASTLEELASGCRGAAIGCRECKSILVERIVEEFTPIREAYLRLIEDHDTLRDALAEGARRCRELAHATMDEVRRRVGLGG